MSCILFSRVSFLALAGEPLFQRVCAEQGVWGDLGSILWEINVEAYRERWGNDPSICEEIEFSKVDPEVDTEFMDYFAKSREPGVEGRLSTLLSRIDYQYAEGDIPNSEAYRRYFEPVLNSAKSRRPVSSIGEFGDDLYWAVAAAGT